MDDPEREWLDRQYDNRARVPNFRDHLEAWATGSAAWRARGGAALDLAYGASERQAIDLFRPVAERPPLIAFIHGGYWQALDRKDFSFVARPFVERGVATAVIGYDLAPAVALGEIVEQIQRALVFLHREGPALGLGSGRIVVAGHSAGGHLAAMALCTDWSAFDAPADLIGGVVAISGLFDLEPIRRCYLNEILNLDQAEARRLSPIAHQPRCSPVPVLIAVGGGESEEFLAQSAIYADHLRKQMNTIEHRVAGDLDHFQIVGRFGRAGHPLVERTLAMVGR
ncbi:MAG: alpha/beta hydrolase [Geminicoccaceae bacterium]|nr:alpha/beta hydrolase [Geminicoccaceae bacterium]